MAISAKKYDIRIFPIEPFDINMVSGGEL